MKFSVKQWLLLLLLFALFLFLNSKLLWQTMYPIAYESQIHHAAEQYQVDPFLIMAVIQTESRFKQERLSVKGASGLMQLMPDTAEWANQESGLAADPVLYQTDTQTNILLGTWYLSFLLQKYDQDVAKTVAAYNAGQGHVDRWLEEGLWDGTLERLDEIPFGETRHYLSRVSFYYQRYQHIYKDDF